MSFGNFSLFSKTKSARHVWPIQGRSCLISKHFLIWIKEYGFYKDYFVFVWSLLVQPLLKSKKNLYHKFVNIFEHIAQIHHLTKSPTSITRSGNERVKRGCWTLIYWIRSNMVFLHFCYQIIIVLLISTI